MRKSPAAGRGGAAEAENGRIDMRKQDCGVI